MLQENCLRGVAWCLAGTGLVQGITCTMQFSISLGVSGHWWPVTAVLSGSEAHMEVLASGVMSKEGGPGDGLGVDWVSKEGQKVSCCWHGCLADGRMNSQPEDSALGALASRETAGSGRVGREIKEDGVLEGKKVYQGQEVNSDPLL